MTMWEVFNFGLSPYGELNACDLFGFLERGQRLDFGQRCPTQVVDWASRCFSFSASGRPDAAELAANLARLLKVPHWEWRPLPCPSMPTLAGPIPASLQSPLALSGAGYDVAMFCEKDEAKLELLICPICRVRSCVQFVRVDSSVFTPPPLPSFRSRMCSTNHIRQSADTRSAGPALRSGWRLGTTHARLTGPTSARARCTQRSV